MIPESKLPLTREQIEQLRHLAAISRFDFGGLPVPKLCDQALAALALERDNAELRTIVKALLKQDKLEHPEFMVVRRRARELVGL